MTMQASIHYASIVIYVLAILLALDTVRHVLKSEHVSIMKELLVTMLVTSGALAGCFSAMQIIWTVSGEYAYTTEWESIGWLLHDWMNGISHLAFILAIRVFVRWDEIGKHLLRYRHIVDDNCILIKTAKCSLRMPKGID